MRFNSKELSKLAGEFDRLSGLELNEFNRKKLYETILKSINQYGFERKDVNKEVHLRYYSHPSMNPDITIRVNNNKIFTLTDCFWRTIEGIYEQEQERKAYL